MPSTRAGQLGLKSFGSASATPEGIKVTNMIRRGQLTAGLCPFAQFATLAAYPKTAKLLLIHHESLRKSRYWNAFGIKVRGSHKASSGKMMISSKISSIGIRMIATSRITCATFIPPIDAEINRHNP